MSTYATHEFCKPIRELRLLRVFNHYSSGEIIDGTRIEDATSTSFENNSLELITSNQVFEHIPDDLSAFRECYRILKKRRPSNFSVPLYDLVATKCKAYIEDSELIFIGEPEFHNSR